VAQIAIGDDTDERARSIQYRQMPHLPAAHLFEGFVARRSIADRDDIAAHELAHSHLNASEPC
jgi:hypothetical protein